MTYRPKNECDDCGYTWYPRGKNRSLRCPHCGSRDIIKYETRYTTDWSFRFFLIIIVSLLIGMMAHGKNETLTNLAIFSFCGGGLGLVITYQGD